MSYNKPEKDFGEAPVRFLNPAKYKFNLRPLSNHAVLPAEDSQDPHHPHLPQGPGPREGLP